MQIDREDNNRLEEENRESKQLLKQAKNELDQLRNHVSRVAEEVATGRYTSSRAGSVAARAETDHRTLSVCSRPQVTPS